MLVFKNKFYLIVFLLWQTNVFSQSVTMVDPSNNIGIDKWGIVNDGVMGGLSKSTIYLNKNSNITFEGNISLANNGGFASCRMGYNGDQLKGATIFLLRVKGDGNIYKLRFSMNGSYANYSADFQTKENQWMDIEIPVANFKPYYFGNRTAAPRLRVHKINSVGVLISDKQKGKFSLDIDYLKAK